MTVMRIDVLTLFPEMFEGVLSSSILGRARERGIVDVRTLNFRQFAVNRHGSVDDYPYGGGGGMILRPEPLFSAVESLPATGGSRRVVLLCPQGRRFTQAVAEELANERHLVLICGHYEGVDERVRLHLVDDELSIGDYVLTGGELAAMVVMDAVVRLLPGVLGNERSAKTDSFSGGLLEYPQYTRPAVFRGWAVPDVLLSGHHRKIEEWRRREALRRTFERRPDLLERAELTEEERRLVEQWRREAAKLRNGESETGDRTS